MSLFPNEDALTRLIISWEGYSNTLPKKKRDIFNKMLRQCYQYSQAINSKSEPFSDDALFMALIFLQHEMIDVLFKRIEDSKS
jgi:hypothetical protein